MGYHEKISIPPPLDQIPTSDFNIPDVISKNSTAVNANSRPAVRKPTEENKPILQCGQCDFTANLNRAIKTHMMKNHSVPPASPFSCDMCDYRTTENASLTLHLLDAHMKRTPEISVDKLQSFHCEICTFTALKESTLRDHIKAKHEPPPVQPISLQCELCPYVAPLKINMRRHIAVTHAKIQCDQCHFTSSSQFHLALHKEQAHSQTQPPKDQLFPCSLCGITFSIQYDLDSHIRRRHCPQQEETTSSNQTPNHTLAMVLEEQIDMAQSLKELKASIDAQLSEIRNDQETFRDDIKQLVKDNTVTHSSFNRFEKLQSNIDSQVLSISNFISTFVKTPAPAPSVPMPTAASGSPAPPYSGSPANAPAAPHQHPSSLESPCLSQLPPPAEPTRRTSVVPPSTKAPVFSTSRPSVRLPTFKRHKVLFLTDSIGSMADYRHLEEATNSMIYREEAFGAQYKADAFRPQDNFADVSMHAPSKRNYSYAILQGSSTDITNLDTSALGFGNFDFLKQEVFIASQNMIAAARNILLRYPGVKKVLILDRTPRFDPETADPTQLKSKLSEYGNKVFRDELEKCDVKNKISIGSHILPKQLLQNIYGHPARQGYDGIHPYGQDGRNFLTRSLCNSFQTFLSEHSREHHNHVIPSRTTTHGFNLFSIITSCVFFNIFIPCYSH